jgi:hypothetical protein
MFLKGLIDSILDLFTTDEKRRRFRKQGYKRVRYENQNKWIQGKIKQLNKKCKAGSHYKFTGKRFIYVIYYDKNKSCYIYKNLKQIVDPLPKHCKAVSRRRINFLKANGHRVQLVNCKGARNPTYDEMIKFLDFDKTETIKYRIHKFVCADFAQVLHNRAEKYGIRAGWVSVDFKFGEGHACNAFKTVDKGLIFVDCTNGSGKPHDTTVNLKVGQSYIPKPIHPDNWHYHSMGVVKRYKVYW